MLWPSILPAWVSPRSWVPRLAALWSAYPWPLLWELDLFPHVSQENSRRKTVSESYELEYGTDSIEIHADAITSKDTVLILDDLVATGGTVEATGKLVRDMGAKLVGYGCILELAFLNPREKLTPSNEDVELFSLVTVD